VAEQIETIRKLFGLYERKGVLKPSPVKGIPASTTDGDLERLEVILHLTRDLGVTWPESEIILNFARIW